MKVISIISTSVFILTLSLDCLADAASDLAAANNRKAIAEAEKAIAEAEKAIAEAERDAKKAEAETATIRQELKAKADKADFDASTAKFNTDKAQAEYYKTLIPTAPDLTKLKVDKPADFEYKATINERYFENTLNLAKNIAVSIKKSLGDSANASIVIDDPSIKTATGVYIATKESLLQSQNILELENKLLSDRLGRLCKKKEGSNIQSNLATAYVASELLKTVMGFAIAFKPQYAVAHTEISVAKSEIINAVSANLVGSKIAVYELEKIVPLDSLKKTSDLTSYYSKLVTTMQETQVLLKNLNKQTCELTDDAKEGAKRLKNTLDEISKLTQTLMTAMQNGLVPFDQALKAETLLNILSQPDAYILSVDYIRGANDSFAKVGVFSSRKVHTMTNVQARWALVRPNGEIKVTGITQDTGAWKKVDLPD